MSNTTINTASSSTTPHISFIAFPLGAWLLALIGAGIFAITSPHPEKINIAQIIIAASLAIATVAGTLYVLVVLALKRYPTFKQSFVWGFILALLTAGCAIGMVIALNQAKMAFVTLGGFLLASAIAPLFIRKRSI